MKKVLISILTLIFIISMITTVYAATGSISVGASSDSVVKGKTFTVTVVGTADNNITGLEAKLSYDTSKLSIEGKTAGTGFSDLSGSNEIAIASTSSENLSKTGTLYTITFKVLDTAAEGETTISVTNAILALVNEQATQENTPESSDEVTITIKADDTTIGNQGGTQTPEQNPNENGNNSSNNGNSNSGNTNSGNEDKKENTNKNVSSNKNTSKNTTKNTNKNTTKLPQTGAESASIIVIIALGVMGITSYMSYRKYKNI